MLYNQLPWNMEIVNYNKYYGTNIMKLIKYLKLEFGVTRDY